MSPSDKTSPKKNLDSTILYSRNRPQSVESRRSCEQNEISAGKPRSAHSKLTYGKSVPKVPKKAVVSKDDITTIEIPDQETIRKREELELEEACSASENLESVCDVQKLRSNWNDQLTRFEKLKGELGQRQTNIMQIYITLKSHYKMMTSLGQKVDLPPVDELYIMNVAKIEPNQLLQLCTIGKNLDEASSWDAFNIDIEKLTELPQKLVAVSELILSKSKEIIDWFDALKSEEKGIAMSKLTKKINEFNAENEMLNSSLQNSKGRFVEDTAYFAENLRHSMNEMVNIQLRSEDLKYKLSELRSENDELRKELQSSKNMKFQNHKLKLEELQKELKEEKAKRISLKDRLLRSDGQTKIANEHAAQLEAALDLARSQSWTLERTVKQLNDQNQKLQLDFETELSKLTDSIQENTKHLEEIAEAREKLQIEKEHLQKRLDAITENNNKALQNLQQDLDCNVSNLAKTEAKLMAATEAKNSLETKIESLNKDLLESERRVRNLQYVVQEKDDLISKLTTKEIELKLTTKELEAAHSEITQLKETMLKQSRTIEEIEHNFREMSSIEKTLQSDLSHKENYIFELENKVASIENEVRDSNIKIQDYEHRVKVLKTEVEQIQQDLGEYRNIGELRELINKQQIELDGLTRLKNELEDALQQKELQLERNEEHRAQQDIVIEQKTTFIKRLTEKEEEQLNIIKLLRNNLEMRAHTDLDISQQLAEKSTEVTSLVNSLDSRKQQISQLEKIILTLEDQLRKVYAQRKNDQDKIVSLEKALNENEQIKSRRSIDIPSENLDNLIKILEDELGEPDPIKTKSERVYFKHRRFGGIERPPDDYIVTKDNFLNLQEKIERKKATLHMESPKVPVHLDTVCNLSDDKSNTNGPLHNSDLPIIQIVNSHREDKKRKMFKFAGHKF